MVILITNTYRIGCVITHFELLHALGYNAHLIKDFMLSFITRFGLLLTHISDLWGLLGKNIVFKNIIHYII